MKFNDPKLKNEIFVRIDMKYSTICLQSIFLLFKLLLFAKKYFMFLHMFLLYKVTNLTLYVLVHRNILMYVIHTCMPFIYVDVHLKTILAITLFRRCARGSCVRRWSLLQDCLPVKFKDTKFMKFQNRHESFILFNSFILGERSEPHSGVFNRDFGDIYIYIYSVCCGPKSVGGTTWAKHTHAQSQYWAGKSDQ